MDEADRCGVRVARVWNVMGALLLLNVMRIAITSFPGPLHLDWPGEPLTIVATFPFIVIPSLMVPLAAWGHLATWKALGRETSPRAVGSELARTAGG